MQKQLKNQSASYYSFLAPCMNGNIQTRGIGRSLNERIGRVEVCVNSSWGNICSQSWSSTEASVICKQLGLSRYGMRSIKFIIIQEVSMTLRVK